MARTVVFDNIIFSLQRAGGISAFWANLIKRVASRSEFDCYYVEYDGARDNIFRKDLDIPAARVIRGMRLPFGMERITEPYLPPKILSSPFVFHSSYYRVFTHARCRNVSTIHDFIHEHGADGNFLTRPLMRHIRRNVLRKSSHVVCVSRNTLDDLKHLYPGYDTLPMSVAYNAPFNRPLKRNDGEGEWLLFVGARDDYKNFRFAVELASYCRMPLKVAGAPFSRSESRWISQTGRHSAVDIEVFPDELRMAELYAGARCLVYMSEYEGFGIPIVEAQASGCPVIGLRRSAVPEIGGEGIILFDAPETAPVAEIVNRLKDPDFRDSVRRRGESNVSRYDWEDTASLYSRLYRRLLKS